MPFLCRVWARELTGGFILVSLFAVTPTTRGKFSKEDAGDLDREGTPTSWTAGEKLDPSLREQEMAQHNFELDHISSFSLSAAAVGYPEQDTLSGGIGA